LIPGAIAFGQDSAALGAAPVPPAIVIGFVGGYVHGNNMVHTEVQLAAKLRAEYPAGVYVQCFPNHNRKQVHAEIVRLLDTDHDGKLSDEEKKAARIILYGHSWGASEAVTLARVLDKEGIPVLLTIQVDSVRKCHEKDALIPANVAEAANFYQPHGLVHGRKEIRAADPAGTEILGNFLFDYKKSPVHCYCAYPWLDRVFMKAHTEIECDPKVWGQVESLIRARLPEAKSADATATPAP